MATKTEILAKLADQHEERIVNVLYDLEDDIINSLQATSGGQKLTTQLAIQLRPNLKRLIEENYLKEADLLVRDYDKVVKNYQSFIKKVPIADRFKTLTKPDLAVINQLKQLSFSGFEDVANRFLTTISDEVYKSAIVGKPFPDMVKAIRGEINGVYQRSNENAIKRLVNIVDKNKYSDSAISKKLTADATRILHTKYASDRVGRNMRLYASQQAHDSIMQFDAQFTKYKAEEAGITSFQYTGTNITTTREFCRARIGNVYTEEEARSIWGGNWKCKSGSDPFIDRGGYRCRHSFIPYDPAWDLEDDVDIKEEKPKNNRKIFNKKNIYSDTDVNAGELNNILLNLEGNGKSTDKIRGFMNAKNTTIGYLPQLLTKGGTKRRITREQYDYRQKIANDFDEVYSKTHASKFPENKVFARDDDYFLSYATNNGGYTSSSLEAVYIYVNKTTDLKTVDVKAIQKSVDSTLKNGGKSWSFSDDVKNATSKRSGNQVFTTTMHELGHQIHYYANSTGSLKKAIPDKILTRYANYNDQEFHAELFTAYSINRKALNKIYPDLVKYMDDLIDEATTVINKGSVDIWSR